MEGLEEEGFGKAGAEIIAVAEKRKRRSWHKTIRDVHPRNRGCQSVQAAVTKRHTDCMT